MRTKPKSRFYWAVVIWLSMSWVIVTGAITQGCAHKRIAEVSSIAAIPPAPLQVESDALSTAPPPKADQSANIQSSGQIFRVALDIGHTPKTEGAVAADGTMEYEFNKRIVHLVMADLEQRPGLSVLVINDEGKEISLPRRSAVANAAKADLFLAVHHDSANDRYLTARKVDGRTLYQTDKFHGYSVFFSKKNTKASASFDFAKALGSAMREQGLTPTAHHAEKIPGEGRELVIPELGVYRFDNLVVLKTAEMPAALLECGVIVNPAEEAELKQPERQAKTVRAIRQAVLAMANAKAAITDGAESRPTENH
jgi:N-acetylmuramoyl-L-alanine amidase